MENNYVKKFYILLKITLFIVIFMSSCGLVLTRELEKTNPVEYQFDFPLDTVRNKIEKIEYLGQKITHSEYYKDKFVLMCFYCDKSKLYYNLCGNLKMYAVFNIYMDSISKNITNVRIESLIYVISGYTINTNHGIPYIDNWDHKVKQSTIEEYEILKIIGDSLKQKNMPEINYPK